MLSLSLPTCLLNRSMRRGLRLISTKHFDDSITHININEMVKDLYPVARRLNADYSWTGNDAQLVLNLRKLLISESDKIKSAKKYENIDKITRSFEVLEYLDNLFTFDEKESYSVHKIKALLSIIKDSCEDVRKERRLIIPSDFVVKVTEAARKRFVSLPNVIRVLRNNPTCYITVCGDTHGQYLDFASIFSDDVGGFPSTSNIYIFNGDMVDRGEYSVEILLINMLIMLSNPIDTPPYLYMLRGNHESKEMTASYGFKKELERKYNNSSFYPMFLSLFQSMPIAAVIEDETFVVHGGLGQLSAIMTIKDINERISRFCEPFYDATMAELLWSDPREIRGFSFNSGRGGGVYFGGDVTNKFLSRNGLKLIVRSHEVCMKGYEYSHDQQLITVFSAPNYCGQQGNDGAIVRFVGSDSNVSSLTPQLITFKAYKK
eukprot:gene16317-22228_t